MHSDLEGTTQFLSYDSIHNHPKELMDRQILDREAGCLPFPEFQEVSNGSTP